MEIRAGLHLIGHIRIAGVVGVIQVPARQHRLGHIGRLILGRVKIEGVVH